MRTGTTRRAPPSATSAACPRFERVLFRFDEADRSQGSRQLETGLCAAASGGRLVDGGPGVSSTDYLPKTRTNQGLGPCPSCATSYQISSNWQAANAWPLVAGVQPHLVARYLCDLCLSLIH